VSLDAALVCAAIGLVSGAGVPRMIAALPEPEPDPDENPDDFPDKVLYADVAATPGLVWGSAVACAVAGGLIGLTLGWTWLLPALLLLVPVCCALTVVDWRTWFLPTRIVMPAMTATVLLVAVETAAAGDWGILWRAAVGWAVLGGYYGLMWFISPRIMAFGDVRLGALLGLVLGPLGWGALILSAVAAGLIGAFALLPMRRAGLMIKRHAPFGPFLVLGALVAVLVAGLAA
jgi:leader peptidase (prepilin peptidase)/N-methyltransferase